MQPPARRSPVLLPILLALQGGWMLVDGATALATGDYIGGELGPWAAIPRAVGLDPLAMAGPFVLLGAAGVALAVVAWRAPARAAGWALAYGVATLWYAVIGTLVALGIVAAAWRERRRDKA